MVGSQHRKRERVPEMKTNSYRVIGTTRDRNTCECCGKTSLKKTVMLQWLDEDGNPEGEIVYFGTTCASHAILSRTGQTVSGKQITEDARLADAFYAQIARERAYAEHNSILANVQADTVRAVELSRTPRCIYRTEHQTRREEYADFPPVTYGACFPLAVQNFPPNKKLIATVTFNPSTRRAEIHPALSQEAV